MENARHVVIVGAGPGGASLAYLLARRGIGVTLLERQTDFEREFRGEVLMPSGLDAFRQMGLEPALKALPSHQVTGVDVYNGQRRLFHLDFTPAQVGAFGPKVVSQPALLEMLVAESARFPAFRLERGFTVRDLVRVAGRVVGVRGESGAGTREVTGDFVVGTDGRASIVRRRADLEEERAPQAFDVVWAKVPRPAFMADGATARAFLGRRHLGLAIPIYDGLLQIAWIIAKGSYGELRKQGMDEWIEEMAAHVSPDLGAYLLEHRGRVTQPFLLDVVCDLLPRWTAPGLLLLGDAAHPMSPVGGQGLNIALRDALVAANHLVPALQPGTPEAEIDETARRVQEERMPEVREIQTLQQIPPRIIFGEHAWNRILLGSLLPFLVRTGIPRLLLASTFRKFALGVTEVRLAA
jgi:2-polyprenyl-6-methoxyphenol hydroxylase-like FAD-dependent oxidoreductase